MNEELKTDRIPFEKLDALVDYANGNFTSPQQFFVSVILILLRAGFSKEELTKVLESVKRLDEN